MATWDAVTCSSLALNDLGDLSVDLGFVQFLLGLGGSPFIFADITHAGFQPRAFFDALVPGDSSFILSITFTFDFLGGSDTAFREIYYNDVFFWADNGISDYDFETAALHEAGHGLSLQHFATPGPMPKVMNPMYTAPRRSLTGGDIGCFCGIWASWP